MLAMQDLWIELTLHDQLSGKSMMLWYCLPVHVLQRGFHEVSSSEVRGPSTVQATAVLPVMHYHLNRGLVIYYHRKLSDDL